MNPERLRNLADRILNMADGRADRDPASLRREAEFVRALASALREMEKDSARLDWLEAQIKRDMLTTFGEFDPLSRRWQMVDGSLVDDFRSALDAARSANDASREDSTGFRLRQAELNAWEKSRGAPTQEGE